MDITEKMVKISTLHEDPDNARLHDQNGNLEAIKASLTEFGQVEALVVQAATGKVVGGNGRIAAMRQLGWKEVRVFEVDFDDAKCAALAVALNRTAELAAWDDKKLLAVLENVQVEDPALQKMFDDLEAEFACGPTELKTLEVKKPPAMTWVLLGIPTVRFGEIAEQVERLAAIPDTIVEMTSNDDGEDKPDED